jgi:hypothetical protein
VKVSFNTNSTLNKTNLRKIHIVKTPAEWAKNMAIKKAQDQHHESGVSLQLNRFNVSKGDKARPNTRHIIVRTQPTNRCCLMRVDNVGMRPTPAWWRSLWSLLRESWSPCSVGSALCTITTAFKMENSKLSMCSLFNSDQNAKKGFFFCKKYNWNVKIFLYSTLINTA